MPAPSAAAAAAAPAAATTNAPSPFLVSVPDAQVHQAIAQYLYDSNLHESLAVFLAESKQVTAPFGPLTLNAQLVREAKWDELVMALMESPLVPRDLAFDVMEHVCWELGPVHSMELATKAPVLRALKLLQPTRHAALARVPSDLPRRRQELADKIEAWPNNNTQPSSMLPRRLVNLVHDAMRFKRLNLGADALLHSSDPLGLFGEQQEAASMSKHVFPTRQLGSAKVVKGVRSECACYSPDGSTIALGTSDGFVELLLGKTLKRRRDLAYQSEAPLLVPSSALCVAFDTGAELLAVGDASGSITVFKVADGTVAREIRGAHAKGVLCVAVEGGRLLSGGVDSLARVFGLRSGTAMCELRGHASYVNACVFAGSDGHAVTGGQEGTVRGWLLSTSECVFKVDLGSPVLRVLGVATAGLERGMASFTRPEAKRLMVCVARAVVTLDADNGREQGRLTSTEAELVDCCVSRSGGEVMGLTAKGALLCWDGNTLIRVLSDLAATEQALRVLQHPTENIVAVLGANSVKTYE